ncbi:unnamed protein product [Mytilus coruscus]|uniref:OTU domain-containing protein n=1 Tax=Mytilus coruscus TaxID=42192 RepID=A0A6J8DKE9_MYTCO|nr:unnamed protein product [Mytilus coruscus]
MSLFADDLQNLRCLISLKRDNEIENMFQECKTLLKNRRTSANTCFDVFSLDTLSNALKPDDCTFIAIKTRGNGNCLYNSMSMRLLKFMFTENIGSRRALLTPDQYSNHPSIEEARLSDHMFTDHEDTIFSMILTESASTEFDRTRCRLSAIRLEALLTCDNFR